MSAALAPVLALLLGAAILLLGNGLQGILLPLRASAEGFATPVIGLLGTAYSVGFVAGCLYVPRIVGRVGHIRSFAVFAALAAVVVQLLGLAVQPLLWVALRVVTGFSFAGLFMIIESWLNERADNASRGQVFATYMMVNQSAVTVGLLLLPLTDLEATTPFTLVAVAITLSLVPVSLTGARAPQPPRRVRLRLRRLYARSPVGMVGAALIGLANGAFNNLAAVYASSQGLSVAEVALFMSAALLGGALAQVPIGRLSDRVDRRAVMIGACAVAVLVGLHLSAAGGVDFGLPSTALVAGASDAALIGLAFVFGACFYPLYSLCVAHINDFAAPEDFVETSGGLLLTFGTGAAVGALLAAQLMTIVSGALFVFVGAMHLCFALFTAWRLTRRAAPAARGGFVQLPTATRTTPAAASFDPRATAAAAAKEEVAS